jgi:predicted ATPase
MSWLPLRTLRIQRYKAIVNSGRLTLGSFTLLIGNNGSGKSSLIEALETLRAIGTEPLDEVFVGPRSIEHVLHKGKNKQGKLAEDPNLTKQSERLQLSASGMNYYADASAKGQPVGYTMRSEIAAVSGATEGVRLCEEAMSYAGRYTRVRDSKGLVSERGAGPATFAGIATLPDNESMLRMDFNRFLNSWQVLGLIPEHMGLPTPRRIMAQGRTIARDGSDVAESLFRLAEEHPDIYQSIVETMQYILGYVDRVEPRQDLGAIRNRYIELDEREYTIPGWMLSTGTLRVLALLIALRRPQPPTLLCIEEIENGLDPRTLSIIVDEIKFATSHGRIQVIATTHSPHLLDQVDLDQIILVQRRDTVPHFLVPSESEHVKSFARNFDPGRLYTMGVLKQAAEELLG